MKHLDYHWHLRAKMAAQGMFATTDLQPHLAERGITLSREQVYRLVTGHPQRMSMDTLIALCDILDCTPNDLIEPAITETATATKAAAAGRRAIRATAPRRRTTITRPTETPE
ncbi:MULTISPECIES: helix-turn-helix domain-containing protein [Gordonia]|jgi:DNA-binding Xre family transcriptional regulator|uniref:helix-turn-helix domain-containing protein n=1 Tax=Gordonia TaxID=2053 RepID=UPI000FDD35D3|nr:MULTISPECIES: helix-turn-helix transcriptional regulator [Gordonia]AZZ82395.1 XRE family transcriptional regulator [Gordonia alkanivorans]MCK8616726.1 helix-turn-helix transcriptional regulator [Gordonia sp. C13]